MSLTLEEGAYWVHDIIGLTAVTVDGIRLGVITDVLPTGANDVYVVRPDQGFNGGREVLLPAMTDVVDSGRPRRRHDDRSFAGWPNR